MSPLEDAQSVLAQAECLCTVAQVQEAYDRLAARIAGEYAGLNPLILVVMVGGLVPAAEILRRMDFAFELDYIHATRYRSSIQGGGLVWKRQPDERLKDRHVLVIDDILDEGHTLAAIRKTLTEFDPLSVKVAVLADKLHDRRAAGAHAEFIGLELPDRYVFGCGMDYREYWRQLPAIYAVK